MSGRGVLCGGIFRFLEDYGSKNPQNIILSTSEIRIRPWPLRPQQNLLLEKVETIACSKISTVPQTSQPLCLQDTLNCRGLVITTYNHNLHDLTSVLPTIAGSYSEPTGTGTEFLTRAEHEQRRCSILKILRGTIRIWKDSSKRFVL